jgi:methylthioribose-1-phosphate isomerase
MRTIFWEDNLLKMIDQRRLPGALEIISCKTYQEVADAIQRMAVRGAPAIGVAVAFGLALAGFESRAKSFPEFISDLELAGKTLKSARPTAVNLAWAVDRVITFARGQANIESLTQLKSFILREAMKMADEDVIINKQIGQYGAVLINDGDTIIHHCNTGALAAVDWGTALGVIRTAHEQGKHVRLLVDETRPRLQGARLTAWELKQYGIPFEIITDNMAGYFLSTGQVQKVFFGGDRVAANGDVANKIGTYMLALAAYDNKIPTYTAVPTSTIDLSLPSGALIPIEERDPQEVLDLQYQGEQVVPQGTKARNPAFDLTPFRLITGIITENGIVYPPFELNLPKFVLKEK